MQKGQYINLEVPFKKCGSHFSWVLIYVISLTITDTTIKRLIDCVHLSLNIRLQILHLRLFCTKTAG